MACRCKNDVTKLACELQTISGVLMCLCEDCGNCKKILYEEEGEIEFDSDYVHDEEE